MAGAPDGHWPLAATAHVAIVVALLTARGESRTHLCADDKADVGKRERVRRSDVARVVGVDHVGVDELGRRIAEAVPLNLKAKHCRENEHCQITKQYVTIR